MSNQSQLTAVPNENRDSKVNNSTNRSSSGSPELPLPTLYLLNFENISQEREEDGQHGVSQCTSDATLENALGVPTVPVQCKSTRKNFGQKLKRFSDHLNM